MAISILVVLFLFAAFVLLPMAACSVWAWRDGKRHRRKLIARSVTVASVLSVSIFFLVFLPMFWEMGQQNAMLGWTLLMLCGLHLILMSVSSLFGAIGYEITFRVCRFTLPAPNPGNPSSLDPIAETKNPYQSPRS